VGKESPSWMVVVYVVSRVMERVTSSGAASFTWILAAGVGCNDNESFLLLSFPVPFR
jgi:hypothetical protein